MSSKNPIWNGLIYKKLEAAERLEEITPFTTGGLQRLLSIGYGQAALIVDMLEKLGILSFVGDDGYRHVLVSPREAAFRVLRYLYGEMEKSEKDEAEDNKPVYDEITVDEIDEDPLFPLTPWLEEENASASKFCDTEVTEACFRDVLGKKTARMTASGKEPLLAAVEIVCSGKTVSTARLQRNLGLGYGRAAALIDAMEEMGIVGPDLGNKNGREVLLPLEKAMPLAEEWLISRGLCQTNPRQESTDTPSFTPNENPVLFMEALEALQGKTEISASGLGRLMGIGYPRASVVMQWLIEQGIVSSTVGGRRCREILLSHEEASQRLDQWIRQRMVK